MAVILYGPYITNVCSWRLDCSMQSQQQGVWQWVRSTNLQAECISYGLILACLWISHTSTLTYCALPTAVSSVCFPSGPHLWLPPGTIKQCASAGRCGSAYSGQKQLDACAQAARRTGVWHHPGVYVQDKRRLGQWCDHSTTDSMLQAAYCNRYLMQDLKTMH